MIAYIFYVESALTIFLEKNREREQKVDKNDYAIRILSMHSSQFKWVGFDVN